jgi:integrase
LSWVNFHTFRHTYATWMRRYGGLDEIGLVATGHWRDPRSARRYAHAISREEWSKVEMLPAIGRGKSVESG